MPATPSARAVESELSDFAVAAADCAVGSVLALAVAPGAAPADVAVIRTLTTATNDGPVKVSITYYHHATGIPAE
ncbi:hypothetical protein ACWC9T_36055 [Kitasatospora sp. NPDC001159]